jgi:hypothetical protein
VPNNVGKMRTKVYTKHILPTIKNDLLDRGLTLCQDHNSAHTSKITAKWAKDNSISLLMLPGVSPDLSICKTMANPLKKAFHGRRSAMEKAARARFQEVLDEMDQETINYKYMWYTKRL